jgi:hypothetical protein
MTSLDLTELGDAPGLTAAQAKELVEAASVCLESNGHGETVPMQVDQRKLTICPTCEERTVTRLAVTDQMRNGHNQAQRATENGACGVTLAYLASADYEVKQQAQIGPGFDYHVGKIGSSVDPRNFGAGLIRLEISGIRTAGPGDIAARVSAKLNQTKQGDDLGGLAIVSVVEFGRPCITLRQR